MREHDESAVHGGLESGRERERASPAGPDGSNQGRDMGPLEIPAGPGSPEDAATQDLFNYGRRIGVESAPIKADPAFCIAVAQGLPDPRRFPL